MRSMARRRPVVAVGILVAALLLFDEGVDTGARVHLCRLSSAAGIELVRRAKAERLPITCDVSINSLHLTDVDIGYFNADMRLVPGQTVTVSATINQILGATVVPKIW